MLVSDILGIVKSKALGRDNYTPEQDTMLLEYLNQAHFKLWDVIAHLDDAYLVIRKDTLTHDNNSIVTEDSRPIKARLEVFNDAGHPLKEVSRVDWLRHYDHLKKDKSYFFKITPFSFCPTFELAEHETMAISYAYTPSAARLSLSDDLDLIYPDERLQYLLGDGAFYYLCYAEEGTRPTRQQDKAMVDFERLVQNEAASLMNVRKFSAFGVD